MVRIWAVAAMLAGLLLLLDDFHIIRVTMATIWPIGLIAAGCMMLGSRLNWTSLPGRFTVGSNANSRPVTNRLEEVALFSQVRRCIETQSFEGGDLSSVFGGIELDLRWATISTQGKVAVLEANAAFGAIELRIPENLAHQPAGERGFWGL